MYVVFAKSDRHEPLRVNYPLDYTSQYLILTNLYCKVTYIASFGVKNQEGW